MSDSPVPAYVDTRKIFLQHAAIAGHVSLDRLERFKGLLASDSASIHVELEFFTDEFGRHIISGNLHAAVEVICQRCLEPLEIVLQDDIKLAVLEDDSKAAELDADLDPWICADTKLELSSLVEEQLILCLPIVSLHESTNCNSKLANAVKASSNEPDPANGTVNPFAVLQSLKGSDRIK